MILVETADDMYTDLDGEYWQITPSGHLDIFEGGEVIATYRADVWVAAFKVEEEDDFRDERGES